MTVRAKMLPIVFIFVALLCGSWPASTDTSRILGVFPVGAYSHYALGSRLMKALAEKGHDVTIITPYREKNPPKNYREIFLEGVLEEAEG